MNRTPAPASGLPVRPHRFLTRRMALMILSSSALLPALMTEGQVAAPGSSESAAPEPTAPAMGTPQFQPVPAGGLPTTEVGPRLAGTSQLSGATTPGGLLSVGEGLLRWGALHLRPHIDYQLSYGNNLQPVPGQQVNTLINQLSPGVLIELGEHWSLDYTPTLRFYSDSHFQDATDHAVSLSGHTAYENWTLGLSQGYANTSQPLVETAAQTSQETFATALSASRPLGGKLTLDLSLSQNFLFVDATVPSEALTDSRSWSTLDWLRYQLLPQLNVGLGLGFNYYNMSLGPDMMSEQYQGQLTWNPGPKLTLVFSAGLWDMQFLNSASSDLLSPVFSLSAQYHLFEPTTLFVGASRGVSPSYFESQVSESTGVNGGLSQRLLGRLYLTVSGGYGLNSYHASATGPAVANVTDYNTASYNVSLGTSFLTRANASVFFSQSFILSSGAATAYNYNITQAGLELSYRY